MTDKSTDTLEQIAERLPDEYLPMEGRRIISQTVLAIAISSPEAEEYWSDKHCQAVRTRLSALTMRQIRDKPDCIVEVAEQAIRESK